MPGGTKCFWPRRHDDDKQDNSDDDGDDDGERRQGATSHRHRRHDKSAVVRREGGGRGSQCERGGHREHMRQMNQMFRDPFGNMGGGGLLALPGATRMDRQRQQQQAQNMQVSERSLFMDPFSHFDSMFSNMRSMMSEMHRAFEQPSRAPNAQMYQQSSFMSYSSAGSGTPQVYQASSSTRQGPGGVRETRRTVRDSETGLEKMAVGHHINDRGHVVERSRNARTGEAHENQELINLDEEEAAPFDQEYQEKWRSTMRGVEHRRRTERSRHAPVGDVHRSRHAALPESESTRRTRKASHRKE
ncbi:myeloid leukemia factor 1 [Aplysia californica]|uniref:Myeloid leukemia factor 1 n=1 Tax=Aplysia californica TaxID=6500 RepID=A0ABM0K8X1_APLCA|nr:myeloid leukemia factor 1 [Aplysia californica]